MPSRPPDAPPIPPGDDPSKQARGQDPDRRAHPLRKLYAGLLLFVIASVLITLAYQAKAPIEVAVGERRADPFIEGFSFRERAPSGSFRWSGERAQVYFGQIGNQDGVLRITFGAPQGHVLLWANGRSLTPQPIGSAELKEYVFPVERSWLGAAGTVVLTLESETFAAPPDTRELGAQVVSVTFEPGGGLVLPAPLTVIYVLLTAVVYFGIICSLTGSTRAAYAAGAAVVVASVWGLWHVRLEAAWLVEVVFWFGVAIYGAGWVTVWLLKRFCTLSARELRLVGWFCLAAFAVRIPFAITPGHLADVQDFVVWSYKLTHYGLSSTYVLTEGLWNPNYPPVLLYAFQAIGAIYRGLFAPDFLYPVTAGDPALRAVTTNAALLADPIHRTLLRMPAILADLLTGSLIFALAHRKVRVRKAWLIAATYWFNPVTIYNSAAWGQVDATYTLLMVLAIGLMEIEQAGWAFFALAIGGLTKPQAFVFGPLLLLCVWQRHRWRGLVQASAGGALGLGLVLTPMIVAGAFPGMIARFSDWIQDYPELSLNAHNLWWFVRHGDIAVEDTAAAFAGLSYRTVGLILFAMAYGLALVRTWRCPARSVWATAAYVGFAFFFLPTRMHENYAFPVLALLAMAITTEGALAGLYAVLSLTQVVNYATHDPSVFALFGLSAPDAELLNLRWANSAVHTAIFVAWTAWEVVGLRTGSPAKLAGRWQQAPP